jgi:sodium-dependent dicarboxylate transporter 2/3/5
VYRCNLLQIPLLNARWNQNIRYMPMSLKQVMNSSTVDVPVARHSIAARRSKPLIIALFVLAAVALVWSLPAARSEPGTALLVITACVFVSILDVLPIWGMTALLWVLAPLLLFRFGEQYAIWNVVYGSLHPVLIVFLAGFIFAAAARKHGIDERLTLTALKLAGGNHWRLVALVAAATVWLSAWISNVAAAALMFGSLGHLVRSGRIDEAQQRSLMLATAVAANLGGMSTPIGSGPNAIAIASVSPTVSVSFLEWTLMALPLTLLMVVGVTALGLVVAHPARWFAVSTLSEPPRPWHRRTAVIFCLTVAAWLLEPWHGTPTHVIAACAIGLLLLTRSVTWQDAAHVDWGTLALIAGGIGIGSIMNRSGAAHAIIATLPLGHNTSVTLLLLCGLSAMLAGVMSNTGTAALMVPIGLALLPAPSTAIILALATAFGFPFVISTPANALAARHGARSADLLIIGVVTLIIGCLILAFTGPIVLRWIGFS